MIMLDGVEMVDVREAARLAGRTPETIRRWVWTGRAGAVKQGSRLLIPRAAIETLAGAGRTRADDDVPASSLADWAAAISTGRAGKSGASAADLIFEDRAGR
jgi:excisionase family DNA binding protein